MNTPTICTKLNHLGLLCIAGEGAKKFLQGQLTCNMDDLTPTSSLLGAHCNPQGRVISLFKIFLFQDKYYLQMPCELIPVAYAALKKYAVFFKVTLEDVSNNPEHISYFNSQAMTSKHEDISAGIPAIYPETSEKFLPHELNLHILQGISFNKGCYTGQEIIARMQYRGKLKNHMYLAQSHSTSAPMRGNEIFKASGACGTIVDFAEVGYNSYELLVIAPEADVDSTPLFLDEDKTILLKIVALPYSL